MNEGPPARASRVAKKFRGENPGGFPQPRNILTTVFGRGAWPFLAPGGNIYPQKVGQKKGVETTSFAGLPPPMTPPRPELAGEKGGAPEKPPLRLFFCSFLERGPPGKKTRNPGRVLLLPLLGGRSPGGKGCPPFLVSTIVWGKNSPKRGRYGLPPAAPHPGCSFRKRGLEIRIVPGKGGQPRTFRGPKFPPKSTPGKFTSNFRTYNA